MTQRFDGEIDTVLTFTQNQIEQFLNLRLGAAQGPAAMTFLRQQHLLELGDRPQLLDIIIQSLPALKEREAAGASALTIGALYQTYTNKWLDEFDIDIDFPSGGCVLQGIVDEIAEDFAQGGGMCLHQW